MLQSLLALPIILKKFRFSGGISKRLVSAWLLWSIQEFSFPGECIISCTDFMWRNRLCTSCRFEITAVELRLNGENFIGRSLWSCVSKLCGSERVILRMHHANVVLELLLSSYRGPQADWSQIGAVFTQGFELCPIHSRITHWFTLLVTVVNVKPPNLLWNPQFADQVFLRWIPSSLLLCCCKQRKQGRLIDACPRFTGHY